MEPQDMDPASWVVAAGRDDRPGSPLNVPIMPASNFILGGERGYARDEGTPTWDALEDIVGGLEHGRAVAFASGMAAIAAVFEQLPIGAHIVLPHDCYQGVTQLVRHHVSMGRWSVEEIEVGDTNRWVERAKDADLIWLESPSNPLLEVADLPTICAASRKPGAILGIDNTFATPLNQQPLLLGADVSVHAATKYIGGHSDLLAGIAVTQRDDLLDALRAARTLSGATPGVLESFLAVRGSRTLAVRLAASQANAMELARRLERHPEVECVRYPGLPTHPTHEIAKQTMRGFGTVISFDVKGGAPRADAVCSRVRLIRHATSLGSVESTMERRAAIEGQTHLPPALLRLSVGCESVEDLWRDLAASLEP